MSEDDYDMILKIVLIGDSSVGKTNLMNKYIKNEFREDTKATVGVEFGSKVYVIENHRIKAQIWDTAGQERYRSIANTYYKGSKGAFIVYDITRKETFDSVDKWVNDLITECDKNISIILIGNKNDLENQRQVTKEQGEEKAKAFQLGFFEMSALTGDNLEKGFNKLISEIYEENKNEFKNNDYLNLGDAVEEIKLKNDSENENKCCKF
jgi:Ras-related protein Rab-11A